MAGHTAGPLPAGRGCLLQDRRASDPEARRHPEGQTGLTQLTVNKADQILSLEPLISAGT